MSPEAGSELPRAYTLELQAGPGDIDDLGHVSNLVYLRWVQEAAVAHSERVGYDLTAYRAAGGVFVVRRHEIEYLAPIKLGERVQVRTEVVTWRGPSAERRTTITRDDGREAARALTHWVFVSVAEGRPRRVPPELAAAFGWGQA